MSDQINTDGQSEEDSERLRLFGKRLELAVLLHGSSNTAFIKQVVAARLGAKGSFYNHTGGKSRAQDKTVRAYERLLDLPDGWLWRQDLSSDELDEVREALKEGERDNPALLKIRASIPESRSANNVVSLPINQSVKHFVPDSSITVEIRHIPILPPEKISAWLAGERSYAMLSAKPLPIPDLPNLGPRTWAHMIAAGDFSMTGMGDISYPPGTILTVNPDQEIIPGDRMAIRLRSRVEWLVRRYQAPWPLPADLAKAQEFTLVAINQSFEAIRVTNPRDWEVGGCVMGFYRQEKY